MQDRCRFPGLIAPASLKQAVEVGIEPDGVGFPGLIAPASLKRRNPQRRPNKKILSFSGVNCPGLIEVGVSIEELGALVGTFSGVNCPGLIEAGLHS